MTTAEVSQVEAALAKFRHELEHLRDEVARGEAAEGIDVTDPQLRRAVCFHAVVEVINLLHELGWERERLSVPFFELQTALEGLAFGRQAPILSPDTVGHRPPLATWVQLFRGHVVAVQDRLMGLGFSKEEAARVVFNGLGVDAVEALSETSRSTPKPRRVSKWRESCSEAEQTSPIRQGFDAEKSRHAASGAFASRETAISDAEVILKVIRDQVLSPTFESQNPKKPGS